jgi:hypothetical protein
MNQDLFPDTFVSLVADHISSVLTDKIVVTRPVRETDPSETIGIFPTSWRPDDMSAQIGQMEMGLSRYTLTIQNIVKSMDEVEGRRRFSLHAKLLRAILYRDDGLRVLLGGLEEELMGTKERVKRYGIVSQNFVSNEFPGAFIYLGVTEFYVETETTLL